MGIACIPTSSSTIVNPTVFQTTMTSFEGIRFIPMKSQWSGRAIHSFNSFKMPPFERVSDLTFSVRVEGQENGATGIKFRQKVKYFWLTEFASSFKVTCSKFLLTNGQIKPWPNFVLRSRTQTAESDGSDRNSLEATTP